jgi:4-alpha-glucanotransferase
MSDTPRSLEALAALYGVETSYYDIGGRLVTATPESLVTVLRLLGAPLQEAAGAPDAIDAFEREAAERLLEPVLVAWDGHLPGIDVRLPEKSAGLRIACRLQSESPEGPAGRRVEIDLATAPVVGGSHLDGVVRVVKRVEIPAELPPGYHRLTMDIGGRHAESRVISAPRRAPELGADRRGWGVFLPLYALHRRRSWGVGDFSDLRALAEWVGAQGGKAIGTLPLLATFLGKPLDYSPYAPASRLFWNEIFVDVEAVPELQVCAPARRLMEAPRFAADLRALREGTLVDYARGMRLKRRVLAELSRCLEPDGSPRGAALRRFVDTHPQAADYARFRAVGDRRRRSWQAWPRRLRAGALRAGDGDAQDERYHLYAQFVAAEQLEAARRAAAARGVDLYLDLPVGVHPSSYDVFRDRAVFVTGASAGAPPDGFFTRGQDWGFYPLHPQRLREEGYRHVADVLRHHLEAAGVLRIDHVMWLHRLFFVPPGLGAAGGVYVRYHPDELYAVLCLEAHLAGGVIVGEDLGTVPPVVREEMGRRSIHRLYVAEMETAPRPEAALNEVPARSVASLNTHDMPTFAAFWDGLDIQDRLDLGLLDASGAAHERAGRAALREALAAFLRGRGLLEGEATRETMLRGCLRYLAASPAALVLVNLEDLWLETRPQNVPGTGLDRPNWRRKCRLPMELFQELPEVVETLNAIARLRQPETERMS